MRCLAAGPGGKRRRATSRRTLHCAPSALRLRDASCTRRKHSSTARAPEARIHCSQPPSPPASRPLASVLFLSRCRPARLRRLIRVSASNKALRDAVHRWQPRPMVRASLPPAGMLPFLRPCPLSPTSACPLPTHPLTLACDRRRTARLRALVSSVHPGG